MEAVPFSITPTHSQTSVRSDATEIPPKSAGQSSSRGNVLRNKGDRPRGVIGPQISARAGGKSASKDRSRDCEREGDSAGMQVDQAKRLKELEQENA
jgi:hypothetical protein